MTMRLLFCFTLGGFLLTACESNTAKDWQRVLNDSARNSGRNLGY